MLFRGVRTPFARGAVRDFAATLESDVTKGRGFRCLITDDAELLRLNQLFRRKSYPADVLSFPSADEKDFLGEVAISLDRAKEQAREHGHTALDEVQVLMLHGVLHLMGMDHEQDGGRMERAEMRWRSRLGLPKSLIERARQ